MCGKRHHHTAFSHKHNDEKLWTENDDSDVDDKFQQSLSNVKQGVEEKKKEKEKKLKQ